MLLVALLCAVAKFSLLVSVTKSKHLTEPVALSRCCMAAWVVSVSEQLTLAFARWISARPSSRACAALDNANGIQRIADLCQAAITGEQNYEKRTEVLRNYFLSVDFKH